MQPTTNPTAPRSRDAFQTLFDRFFGETVPGLLQGADATLLPRTNIAETDHAYVMSFELPGMQEQDIHVNLQDRMLTVMAERRDDRDTKGTTWHRVEHRYGQQSRTIQLPQDAAANGVDAIYKNGVLTVTVPKAPESRPTKVPVKSA